MSRTRTKTIRRWKVWGFKRAMASDEFDFGAHASAFGRGGRMAAHQGGRNVHRRHAGSRRARGSNRSKANHGQVDQPGPGRTGARTGAGAAANLREEGDAGTRAVLEDWGGRTRVGDSRGGRGLGRLGSFEHAA